MAERKQLRWETISKWWPVDQHCCRVVEEGLEGMTVRFRGLWRAATDGAGRTGPNFSMFDLPLQKPQPSLGEGLREATGSLAVHPQPLFHPFVCLALWVGMRREAGPLPALLPAGRQPRQGGNWP